jgi:hypothetical protein
VANWFATDRSKTVTLRVLCFVNCLWRLFWNWLLYYHALISSLLFGCVSLLDMAIIDMHISLFVLNFLNNKTDLKTLYNFLVLESDQLIIFFSLTDFFDTIITAWEWLLTLAEYLVIKEKDVPISELKIVYSYLCITCNAKCRRCQRIGHFAKKIYIANL